MIPFEEQWTSMILGTLHTERASANSYQHVRLPWARQASRPWRPGLAWRRQFHWHGAAALARGFFLAFADCPTWA